MSLIPFILDLADELHEFSRCLANGIDINDFGFGLYTGTDPQQPSQPQQQQNQQQQQQQQQPQTSPRRSRTSSFSSFWMPSKRHHPYNRIKTACCAAKSGSEEALTTPEKSDAGSSATSSSSSASIGGTPGKSASYSVVNKNGFQVSMNVKQFAPNELSVKTIDNCIVVEGRHDDKEDGHGVISRHFVRKYMLPKGYDPNDVLSTLSSDGILTVKAPPPPPPVAKNDEPNERIIEIQPTPGPTPVLVVVSAKDTPAKETTKKIAATTPPARLECQLPEKRQKLDLPPEPEPEESTEVPPPSAATATEIDSASKAAAAGVELESDDVEMEKADEQISEIVVKQMEQQQQTSDVVNPENDVDKKAEIIEQMEKQTEEELEENIEAETDKKFLEECMSETNGEKMEEEKSICVADAAEAAEKINETPAESEMQESNEKSIVVTKMDIDDADDGRNTDDVATKTDNIEIVVATIKTADIETKTVISAAAKNDTDSEKTNNTETDTSSSATTITSNNNNNNNNNTSTNTSSSTINTTNNSSVDSVTEKSAKDVKDGNGVVTGEIPVDIPKTDDSAATATENTKAESVAIDGEVDIETAVLSTNTTTITTSIIDDVALLKAATADPAADITDAAEKNVILTESMDGITTTTDSNTTTVDNVDCSVFAKKTHLGNGNNTSATPLVGTEEMAN